ncbi:MAG: MFS transporter [Sphingomonadales bacterium]|nr:MFS transporter [Sphingomonadales bacterium]
MNDVSDPSPRTRGLLSGWPLVAVLMLFYFLSFVDRALISLMVEPIQRDLNFTDVEMGLLLGPAFGIFYAAAGIPIGRLMDRYSKRWLCMAVVAFWGLSTAVSGMATNFSIFFLSRLGLGAGEAGLSPAAYSLMAEQVPRQRLATAYSFYTVGAFAGGGLAIVGGGWLVHKLASEGMIAVPLLGQFYPWQLTFLIVGTLTILAAPLALLLRENVHPAASEAAATGGPARKSGLFALIRTDPAFYLGYPFAFGSVNVIVTAFHVWTPTFMSRTYGWPIEKVGLAYGTTQGGAGVIGLLAMGWLVERLYNRGMLDAHAKVPAIALCFSIPAMIGGILSGSPTAFLLASLLFWGATYTYAGYAPAALQLGTPASLRASVGAVYVTFLSVMGLFIGPTMVSWFTEGVLHDKSKIGLSLVFVMVIWTPIAIASLLFVARRLRTRHARDML